MLSVAHVVTKLLIHLNQLLYLERVFGERMWREDGDIHSLGDAEDAGAADLALQQTYSHPKSEDVGRYPM